METSDYKDYLYSPVRMRFAKTGEIFNIGVIVMDENRENRVFRSINSFIDIANCLSIEEPSSHDFMLNMLNSKLSSNDLSFGENYSNTMYIENPEWTSSEKSISETANELFNDLVTVKRKDTGRKISEYTPKKVITSMEKFAEEHNYSKIGFRNTKVKSMGKIIDSVLYEDDKHTTPIIGIDVVTTALSDFSPKASYSALSLYTAIESKILKGAILRLPQLGSKTKSVEYRTTYHDIKNAFSHITVIDTSDNGEFYGELMKKAEEFGCLLA